MADINVYEGKWELVESDGDMRKFQEAIGTSQAIKAKAQKMMSGMVKEVRHQGENWLVRNILSDRVVEQDYVLGQMVEKVGLDGRPMKGRLYFDDQGLMIEESLGEGFTVRHETRVEGDYLLDKVVGNGVTIQRKYKKIE